MASSSSSDALTRRERERQMRRRAMLDAARAVFAEHGYADATLDEIAERAEFGKGTLYNYFEGGKEALLFAVFDDVIGEMEELIHTEFRDGDAERSLRESFHAFAVRHFELIREQQDLFLILVREAHQMALSDDVDRTQFFREQNERLLGALTPVFEAAVAEGEIRSLPPQTVANLLLANVRDLGTHCTLDQRQHPDDDQPFLEDPEKAADLLTTLLFDGLQTNGSPSA